MGSPGIPTDTEKSEPPVSLYEHDVEAAIGRAVARAARYLPGEHLCLAQAIAGQRMLAAKGIPGTVMVGLKNTGSKVRWDAHAWLIGPRGIIVGGGVSSDYSPVTAYRRATTDAKK